MARILCSPTVEVIAGWSHIGGCSVAAFRPTNPVHQPEKFVSCFTSKETTPQSTGHSLGVLLFYTAHHHAKAGSLDHHPDTLRFEHPHQSVSDFVG